MERLGAAPAGEDLDPLDGEGLLSDLIEAHWQDEEEMEDSRRGARNNHMVALDG